MPAPILLAEPYDDLRELLAADLQRRGYVVEEAKDGDAVLVVAMREKPALIVLAWEIGPAGGRAVVRALQSEGFSDVPVVVLTNGKTELKASAVEAVLFKPFEMEDLANLARRYAGTT